MAVHPVPTVACYFSQQPKAATTSFGGRQGRAGFHY
jgi:hypothetical protein